MAVERDPRDIEATPLRIRELVRRGAIPLEQLDQAIDVVAGPFDPRRSLRAVLLALGAALITSGVAFFVAANWQDIGKLARLGAVAGGVVAAVVVSLLVGPRSTGGRVALAVAGLLTGPSLMLYGQTYQTGADAWELFAGWLLLLLPFAIAARVAGLWWAALLLFHVGGHLLLDQKWNIDLDDRDYASVAWFFVVVDLAALALAEKAAKQTKKRALPRGIALLTALNVSGLGVVGVFAREGNAFALIASLATAAFLIATWKTDLLRGALGFFVVGAVVVAGGGRLFFDFWDIEVMGVFLLGAVVLAYVGGATALLRKWHRDSGARAEDEP